MRYRPEPEVHDLAHVVVDGSPSPATVLTISHWPGTPAPESIAADTSAEMVLRHLDAGGGPGEVELVTNNHFDQDGAAGLFAITAPDAAEPRRSLLADLARAGDFATYSDRRAARASMTLASMATEAMAGGDPYPDVCAHLYTEALGLLAELLDHPERFEPRWRDEDAVLAEDEASLGAGGASVREDVALDLAVVRLDATLPRRGGHRFGGRRAEGPHPMALHACTQRGALLVSHGEHHRFGYRYESWVRYRSRAVRPRVDLTPIADELTSLERDGARWDADRVDELTPEVSVVDGAPSSLPLDEVEAVVARHLRDDPVAFDAFAPPAPGERT